MPGKTGKLRRVDRLAFKHNAFPLRPLPRFFGSGAGNQNLYLCRGTASLCLGYYIPELNLNTENLLGPLNLLSETIHDEPYT